jgi:hypothetical protein
VFSISPIDAAYRSGDAQQAFPSSPRPFGFAPAVSSARITSALWLRDAAAFRGYPNTPPLRRRQATVGPPLHQPLAPPFPVVSAYPCCFQQRRKPPRNHPTRTTVKQRGARVS